MTSDITTPNQEPQDQKAESQNTDDTPEARGEFFIGELSEKFRQENIKLAVVAIADPKLKAPIIYTIGPTYNVTKLLVELARSAKATLNKELEI